MSDEIWKFTQAEQHFNSIQAEIRNRASTWILAAFTAIAVLIKTSEEPVWLIPSAVLIGLVSLMATIGLLVLWINDQLVYQRLLNSVFLVGLKLEYDNSKIPPIRTLMMCSAEGKGMSRWMTFYYTIPMASFLGITLLATFLAENIGDPKYIMAPEISLRVLIGICLIQVAVSVWVQLKKSEVTTRERAGYFGDDRFAAMFAGTEDAIQGLKRVIEQYSPDKTNHCINETTHPVK